MEEGLMEGRHYQLHDVPPDYLKKWQNSINLVAEVFEVPAALIMRVWPEQIEVLVSSISAGNPYEEYEKADLGSGLYCETVMATCDQLLVPNALEDPAWKHNPDVKLNMINYLGIPLIWCDNTVFGTICVLDNKTRHYSSTYQKLLWEFKKIIEGDFRILYYSRKLEKRKTELENLVLARTAALSRSNEQLQHELIVRKQVEEALQKSEAKYKDLYDNSPDMYVSVDPQTALVKQCNRTLSDNLGYSKKEIIDRPIFEIYHPDCMGEVKKTFKRFVDTGWIQDQELQLRRKDGSKLDVSLNVSAARDENGNILYSRSTWRDITKSKQAEKERKSLREQLAQAQKMEAIGNLAGGIAHDFNNILSSVIGFTELALDDVEKGTNVEDSLQELYAAGKRAKDLVKQILTFARQSDEQLKPLEVDKITKEVLKFIRSSIPSSIEIKYNIKSDSLIMGNPTQFHQMLMNLCTNAAYAMEDKGGTLEIHLKDISIARSTSNTMDLKPGDYIEIKVSDTGPGISPDLIESIFEPYFTTKAPGEGTGMGLAMVQGIVESYGGKVTVDSMLGEGTIFKIYLPITRKRKIYRPYEAEELPKGTECILFVDDEAPIVKMGSQILESLGYKVTTRTSSVEALELFRSKPNDFDLVVTDMTMPNMTGDQLSIELMKIRSDIPVILCTGYSKKISYEAVTDIGIKAFAYKPIVKADLANTVRKVLDEGQ